MRLVTAALATAISLSVTACGGEPSNRSVNSVNQPVVSREHYTLDLSSGGGSLPASEQQRLTDWMEALNVGYGDRISIDDPSYSSGSARATIEAVAADYGLLVSDRAPVTTGYVPAGAVRVVISRSTATVPGCPDWSDSSQMDFQGGTSRNYGCGVNSTMAAMIADPEDLVRGQAEGDFDNRQSSKAIDAYRKKAKAAGEVKQGGK